MNLKHPDTNLRSGSERLKLQRQFYLGEFLKYGYDSAKAVGWYEGVQERLFRSITQILPGIKDDAAASLLDIGCGLGDFTSFLKYCGYPHITYTGIDIVSELVSAARKKFPAYSFLSADFMDISFKRRYDYTICSGALNIKGCSSDEDHLRFLKRFIKKMYRLCRKTAVFNLLSIHGREYFPEDGRFFYADPDEIVRYCSRFCPDIGFEYSFHHFCFTVYLNKGKFTEHGNDGNIHSAFKLSPQAT